MDTYLPIHSTRILKKSQAEELRKSLLRLLSKINIDEVPVETRLHFDPKDFVDSVIANIDEIGGPKDIITLYHVNSDVSKAVFHVISSVLSEFYSVIGARSEVSDENSDDNISTGSEHDEW